MGPQAADRRHVGLGAPVGVGDPDLGGVDAGGRRPGETQGTLDLDRPADRVLDRRLDLALVGIQVEGGEVDDGDEAEPHERRTAGGQDAHLAQGNLPYSARPYGPNRPAPPTSSPKPK